MKIRDRCYFQRLGVDQDHGAVTPVASFVGTNNNFTGDT